MSRLKLVEPKFTPCNALLAADCVKDVHVEADLGLGNADEIEAAADAQHGKPLLRHRFQTDEVENVVGASGEERADGFDRFGFGGVNDIGCAEPLPRLQPLWLNVDDDNPRRAGDARTTDGVKPNATGAEDHDRVAGAHIGNVQDRARAGDNAAAEQRRLGERHILGRSAS